jgi:hypothetical protein
VSKFGYRDPRHANQFRRDAADSDLLDDLPVRLRFRKRRLPTDWSDGYRRLPRSWKEARRAQRKCC